MSYGVSLAARDLYSYVHDVSFVGFEYTVQLSLFRGWHLGVAANYTQFSYDEGRLTYHRPKADVTGTLYRTLTVTSVSLTNRYYLLPSSSPVRLYGGLRAGFVFAEANTYVADERISETPVGFLLVPEAGLTVRLSDSFDVVAGYQYNFSTMAFRAVERASYHAFQLGLQFRY
jgi:opacity protein-like surface antigen